ncbi:Imm26 family immunity protein [Paenarthrobacter sp. NPDC057981]|uniref:Imm26 family immunity protein n=1 Tax=Paenarthrobacter sp. NPDC057981 TaxID=3346297 RepID=UPI0036DF7D17
MTKNISTNMRVLKPSRKKPKQGDVFVLQMPDAMYSFGRVINTDANASLGPGAQLIYLFKFCSPSKDLPEISELRTDALLLPPPLMTNLQAWSRGYFETIDQVPLGPGEKLGIHCFYNSIFDRYMDEYGIEQSHPTEPVGKYGLESYRTIDDAVSKALGFPLAPDS